MHSDNTLNPEFLASGSSHSIKKVFQKLEDALVISLAMTNVKNDTSFPKHHALIPFLSYRASNTRRELCSRLSLDLHEGGSKG